MKKANIKTTTYKMEDGFMIDIVIDDETISAWIYHKDYGIKDFMFGVDKSGCSIHEFKHMVIAVFHEYMEFYTEEYMEY